MKYTLTMNEEQARLVVRALDFYIRMKIGQWGELTDLCLPIDGENIDEYCKKRETANTILMGARRAVFPELHGNGHSYGVFQADDTERAFNVLKAVRSCIAWHNTPEGGITVDFDRPFSVNVEEDLPECRVEAGK